MNKRIDYIKEVQRALDLFTSGASILDEMIDKCTDVGFRTVLNDYLYTYALANFEFSSYLIFKINEAYTKDKDDEEFKRIIKGLEDKDGNK